MKQKYTVTIAGNELTIISDESEEYVNNIAGIIDRRVSDMVMVNKRCTRLEAIMLCALDYLDSSMKQAEKIKQLNSEIENLRKMPDAKK